MGNVFYVSDFSNEELICLFESVCSYINITKHAIKNSSEGESVKLNVSIKRKGVVKDILKNELDLRLNRDSLKLEKESRYLSLNNLVDIYESFDYGVEFDKLSLENLDMEHKHKAIDSINKKEELKLKIKQKINSMQKMCL